MKLDEMQVVMLEIVKSAKMEHDENRHNLAILPPLTYLRIAV
jgi:hypothetical protein